MLVAGFVVMTGGALMPWIRGMTRFLGFIDWTGLSDSGEGAMMSACGLLALGFIRWRGVLEELDPRSRWLALVFGAAAACLWAIALRKVLTLEFGGVNGAHPQPGIYVAGIGALITLAGGWLAARRWADPERPPQPQAAPVARPRAPDPVSADGYSTRDRVDPTRPRVRDD
ncbi:MAG TPA: hypothetical protein VH723_09655 [Candidatus Limnocylindrales bacterium]